MVIFLVRHGRTNLNAAGVLRGHRDPPLDDVGRSEAAALGQLFKGVDLAAVISSPLLRGRQTAEAIANGSGVALTSDDGLIDRDYGPWTGASTSEVVARFGSLDDAPGVEPADELTARVSTVITAIADRWTPGPVAVVAHDAINRLVIAALVPGLGDPDAVPQRTGCWNRLERLHSQWSIPVVDALPHDRHRP